MHISTQGLVPEVNYKESDKLPPCSPLRSQGSARTRPGACRRAERSLAAAAQLLVCWSTPDMTLFEYRDYFTLNEAESSSSSGASDPIWRG